MQAAPAGGQAAPPPADLRILVRDLETGELLQVNSNGGDQSTEGDEILRPVARVDPPGAGVYEIRVTGSTGAALAPQIAFGESPIGAVGDRFSKLGELISGPYGILAGALLLAAMLAPSVRRALQSAKRE